MSTSLAMLEVASAWSRICVDVVVHPAAEVAGAAGRLEDEHRRPLHLVVDDGAVITPPDRLSDLDAAVVRGDQGALGGGQRDEVLAPGVLPSDAQDRPREADRDLGHAGEALDVALGGVRLDRVVGYVVGLDAGELGDEPLALGDDLVGAVVVLGVGHADAIVLLGDGVIDLELEVAKVVG